MSFEAKRLRVQLPCDARTVVEVDAGPVGAGPVGGGCRFPTVPCDWGTCWFETPPVCDLPSHIGCADFISETCVPFRTPVTCWGYFTPPHPPPTCWRWHSPICHRFLTCPPRSELVVDPGVIHVAPEDLPRLREQLEAQLAEIEKAETELREREGGSE